MHERDLNALNEHELHELFNIVEAVSQVYPMIVLADLTNNTYSLLKNEKFLYNDVVSKGVYDELIDDNVENIHKNYQHLFHSCFSRENLLKRFESGKTEAYAEVYQKDVSGKYQWVSVHVVRIDDQNGNVRHICLNRSIDNAVESFGNRR